MKNIFEDSLSTKLTRQHKEAMGLLSIGTFLEYFDLMLYVHMALLLNELFFLKTDPFTAQLLSAFGFCSTYLLRPFGALLFGWIGDNIGRKAVVILTTLLMSVSCLAIGMMPTYAQIGITASVAVTICRMVQGMAANAESRGAEIYLSETLPEKHKYPMVAAITVFMALGTSAALFISSVFTGDNVLSIDKDLYWRAAFFLGAMVGIVGTVARTTMKEAVEFADKKKLLKNRAIYNNVELKEEKLQFHDNEASIKTMVAYFFIHCSRPPCFYFIYIYCADVMKHNFAQDTHTIIKQNFCVSLVDFIGILGLVYLSYRLNVLKILKYKFYFFFSVMLFFPIVMHYHATPSSVLLFQCLASLFVFDQVPATPIFFKYFPIFKRFTYTSLLSAVAKLFTYLITSFGLVYANKYFGYKGIFLIFIPVGLMFLWGVSHFEQLERINRKN